VSLPPNTEAVVCLTARAAGDITEAGLPLSEVDGVTEVWQEPGQVLIRLGSGQYIFSVKGG